MNKNGSVCVLYFFKLKTLVLNFWNQLYEVLTITDVDLFQMLVSPFEKTDSKKASTEIKKIK